jgi:hypothetical protein
MRRALVQATARGGQGILLSVLVLAATYARADSELSLETEAARWISDLGRIRAPASPVAVCGRDPAPGVRRSAAFDPSPWTAAGFSEVEAYAVDPSELYRGIAERPPFTHRLELSAVLVKGSRWTPEEAFEELKLVAETYARCGIRIDADIIHARIPGGASSVTYDKAATGPGSRDELGRKTPLAGRSVAYFFERFPDKPIQSGTSSAPWSVGESCPYVGYTWQPYVGRHHAEKSYSTFAHELTHNLANVGHGPRLGRTADRAQVHYRENCDENHYACRVTREDREAKLMLGNPLVRTNELSDLLCNRIRSNPRVRSLE